MSFKNPWENMSVGSEKLVNHQSKFDIYWGVEYNGDLALYINLKEIYNLPKQNFDLKDIDIKFFNDSKQAKYYCVFILKQKSEWELFYRLCEDLIGISYNSKDEKQLVMKLQNRLIRWQELFKKDQKNKLTVEKQMGLFSELSFLLSYVIPKIGIKSALMAWVGHDGDKQDFVFENSVVEVKSYSTTKGEKIIISSKEQLFSNKQSLYLATYSLSKSTKGKKISNLIDDVRNIMTYENQEELMVSFDKQLWEAGYSSLIYKDEDLISFNLDDVKFYIINGNFPRLTPQGIPSEIIALQYKIDMSNLSNYLIDYVDMEIGECDNASKFK